MKADKPAADQKKFMADYQADMKKFIGLVEKTEAPSRRATTPRPKLCAQLGDAQKAGHKQFKKADKK